MYRGVATEERAAFLFDRIGLDTLTMAAVYGNKLMTKRIASAIVLSCDSGTAHAGKLSGYIDRSILALEIRAPQ